MNRHSNRKPSSAWAALVTAAALCLALAPAAVAADIAQVRAGSGGLDFQPRVEYGALVLTVSGPDGFHHRAEFGSGESPGFSVYDEAGGVLPDGSYTWELSVVPSDAQRRDAFEANRMEVKRGGVERLVQTGAFAIIAGSVVAGGETEPGATGHGNVLATKDQVIPDDLIVQMSLCVGFDCVNNENFGFDTIRLKENNLRLHFDDTSSAAGFPANDWRLVANDSASGGRNVFYLEDSTSGREVFSVEAGAPSNALWVDSNGNVGFGTSSPALQLHVKDGNTPGLRLEQDGSSGFTAQTFDIAANEANFFVRDVTNGSKLPFRIRPNAPTSSIDIAADGDVGIGTSAPDVPLHVFESTGADTTLFKLENNGGVRFEFENTVAANGGNWQFINTTNTGGSDLVIRETVVNGTEELRLTETGNLTISGQLVTGGPQCGVATPCDRVFAPDFEVESIEEHAALMWQNSYLPAVGPTEPGAPINLSEKTGGILNELEKAHIYIEQLHGTVTELRAEVTELKRLMQVQNREGEGSEEVP